MSLMVSEKKNFYKSFYRKSMGANELQGVAHLDPKGMFGRIYVGYHQKLLHTTYTGFAPYGFREEYFLCY